MSILTIHVCAPSCVNQIYSSIQSSCVSSISFWFTVYSWVNFNTPPDSLIYTHSTYFLVPLWWIRDAVHVRLNILLRSDIIDTFASLFIFSFIEPAYVCLVTYVKVLKLFPLSSPFISLNALLICSLYIIFNPFLTCLLSDFICSTLYVHNKNTFLLLLFVLEKYENYHQTPCQKMQK